MLCLIVRVHTEVGLFSRPHCAAGGRCILIATCRGLALIGCKQNHRNSHFLSTDGFKWESFDAALSLIPIHTVKSNEHKSDYSLQYSVRSLTCSSFMLSSLRLHRSGRVGAAVTSLYAITSPTSQESALSHWPPDRWIDDFLLRERKTHRPFLLSDLLNFDLHYRCRVWWQGEPSCSSSPPMITWTLSHCSCHPKQLYFIWELSWLYQPHIHTGTICTDHCIPNVHCWHTCKTYSTCKYYQTWLRNTPWHVQTRIYCFILFINGESAFCN